MSPVTIPTPPPLPESPEQRLIDQQLDRTRTQVKTTDVLFGLLAMVVGILSILLAAAVVDHWLFDLRTPGRLAAWLAILGWAGYCTWSWIAPALVRKVNPLYAAQTIERREPSLKNSLVNYLLVRSRPDEAVVVREALERQAASDIANVQVDTAVDRSAVLRLGYVLVAVVFACAIYQVASPKSPWRTAVRVLAPLADIARPSRVIIRDVTPGNSDVFHGHHLTVSALIEGLSADEQPMVLYSTADGQIVDASVTMTRSDDGRRWQCDLPAEINGAQQDFHYRLQAGDAVSEEYRVRVSPAPSAVVRSITYTYPAYTRRSPQTVSNHGDISALEGTRVTVRAEANQPMQAAWIEFDPPMEGGLFVESPGESASSLKRLPMTVEDRVATGSFRLEWDAQRAASRYRSYRVRFVTSEGRRNEHPVVHTIDVQRDLPPEIEVLDPRQSRVEIPEDGSREIVIRTIDPDYGVSVVALRAVAGGTDLAIAPLVNDPAGRPGQIIAKYSFAPREHDLKAGDQVICWARVEDNRTAPGENTPEPNSSRTPNFHLVITPAKNKSNTTSGNNTQSDDASANDTEEASHDEANGRKNEEQGDGNSGESGSTGEGDSGQSPSGQGEPRQGQSEEGQTGQGESQGDSGQGKSSQGQSGGSGSGQSPQGGQATTNPQNAEPNGQEENAGPGDGQGSETQDGSHGNSSGAFSHPASDNRPESPQGQGRPSGQAGGKGNQSADNDGASPSTAQNRESPSAGQPSPGKSDQRPLSTDGAHDREVFERIQEYLQEQQKKQGPGPSNSSGNGSVNSSGSNNQQRSEDVEQRQPDSSPQPTDASQQDERRASGESTQQRSPSQGASEGERSGAGEGGSPQGPTETQNEQSEPQKQSGVQKSPPGLGQSGQSGAGAKPENPQGSPESQEQNRDRTKHSDGETAQEMDSGASSPSTSKQQSDSRGGQGGDRSGGGQQGGGQGAKQEGNDSPGSSSAGDEGSGAASETGEGETSNQAGDQRLADRPTGTPSQTPGAGSGVKTDPRGNNSPQSQGALDDTQPGAAPPNPPSAASPSSSTSNQRGNHDGAGQHTFGAPPLSGTPNNTPPQEPPPAVPEDADVNLDYARKATDLALELLRDQKNQSDAALLEKLGWTPEDVQRFLARWDAMKRAASQSGPEGDEARRTMHETLESLGLRPPNSQVRRGATQTDDQRGLRDSGHRTAPPPEYRKQFEAYLKGAGRRSER